MGRVGVRRRPLGDARLSKRLVKVAAAKAQVPGRAFSWVAKGDWPAVKGFYRMIDQPEDSAITMPNILAPHRRRTIRRMMGQKTFAWIEHHRDLVEVAAEMPQTRLSDVCDREADFFDLFDEQRQHSAVDLLVRAMHDRNIIEEPFKLLAAVRQAPVQSRVRVLIRRQSARPNKKQTTGSTQETRTHNRSGGTLSTHSTSSGVIPRRQGADC